MSARVSASSDLECLRQLLKHHPTPRRRTLLEAMEMGRVELPQSLFLAWLLGAEGPVRDFWLLRAFFECALPEMKWPGVPKSVLPEVSLESERPDIVIEWEGFTLIVEYKVDAPEGKDQVKRYLETFGVSDAANGRVIFLTPEGKLPASMGDDLRVVAISFDKMIDCVHGAMIRRGDQLADDERAFVGEYRDHLKRVRYRSTSLMKPPISESTRLLFEQSERFESLQSQARSEAATFINFLIDRLRAKMSSVLGPDDFVSSPWTPYGCCLFRKRAWVAGEFEYGIAFSCEGILGKKMMHEYGHYVYVGVHPLDQRSPADGLDNVVERLRIAVKGWIDPGDRGMDTYTAWMRQMPPRPSEDWELWVDRVVNQVSSLGTKLSPSMDEFARNWKLVKR